MTTRPELFVVGYPERLVRDHAALVAASRDAGYAAEVVDPSRLAIEVRDGRAQVLVDGAPRTPAVALPRGVNRPWPFVRQVLSLWERDGVCVVPRVIAADRCADKLESARVLAEAGVPVMDTVGVLPGPGVRIPRAAGDAVLVVKPARASKGQGVRAQTPAVTRGELGRPHPLVDGLVDQQASSPGPPGGVSTTAWWSPTDASSR